MSSCTEDQILQPFQGLVVRIRRLGRPVPCRGDRGPGSPGKELDIPEVLGIETKSFVPEIILSVGTRAPEPPPVSFTVSGTPRPTVGPWGGLPYTGLRRFRPGLLDHYPVQDRDGGRTETTGVLVKHFLPQVDDRPGNPCPLSLGMNM